MVVAKTRDRRVYLLLCHYCNKEFRARADDFKSDKVKSCGCNRGKGEITHGLYKHKLYRVYHMMKQRCNNAKHPQFKDWGGRGITYCSEWEDFLTFFTWAITNGYEEGLQLDRTNNDGNYEPSNCRFVTPAINMLNRRCNTPK